MVATLPERLARRAVAEGGIVMLERIAEPLTVTLEAVWHARGDKDEGLQWLLNTLAEICAEIAAEPTAADADEGFSSAR
jgi:DNA-binding transcriptional LysR family regulator